MRLFALVAAFIIFTAYTLTVMAGHGIAGFIELAGREPWALQVFLDLMVMLAIFCFWLVPDAKQRNLLAWPWVIVSLTMGSMGVLLYLVRREFAGPKTSATR